MDCLLRNSVDNFIYETKDIFKPTGGNFGSIQKNIIEKEKEE